MKSIIFQSASIILSICLLGCATLKKPFYYEVERDHQTSYVLGTIHVGVESSEIPGFIFDDMKKSKAFVSEVDEYILDLRDPEKVEKQSLKEFAYRRENFITLSSRLSDDAWQKLKTIAHRELPNFNPNLIDFIPPKDAFEMVQISGQENEKAVFVSRQESYRLRYSRLDLELYEKASSWKKDLIPVDSHEQLEKCEEEFYLAQLEGTLTSGTQSSAQPLLDILKAYREGDESRLLELLRRPENLRMTVKVEDCLIKQRNLAWSEKIDQMNSEKSPFFMAVGTIHLLGPNNLLSLLEKKGFKVQRVLKRD